MEKAGYDFRILILSDHKTLTSTRGHDGDPIPYLIYDSRVDTGAGLPYTEANGLKGPMLPAGTVLMHELFQLPY
jgi:2,3-bisphosphoglycerate-independent phosphoglycerate mutase